MGILILKANTSKEKYNTKKRKKKYKVIKSRLKKKSNVN